MRHAHAAPPAQVRVRPWVHAALLPPGARWLRAPAVGRAAPQLLQARCARGGADARPKWPRYLAAHCGHTHRSSGPRRRIVPTNWKASEESAHSKASEPAHNNTRLFLWRTQALAEGYGHVVWLDSDAFVRDVTLDLPSLLRRYGGEPNSEPSASSASRGFRAADLTDAYFGWDAPYSLGPNAGFVVLRGKGGEGGEGGEGGTGGSGGRGGTGGTGGRGGRAGKGIGTGGTGGTGGGTAGALEMLAVWWQLYHGQ
eukprot:scaffold440_cov73-Phaeocystis_antarctica.AAC.1